MEARSDAPFSGEVEAGRMSNLYQSVGGEVDVQGLDRGGLEVMEHLSGAGKSKLSRV